MNQISAYSVSGYQDGLGGFARARVEHEHCPPHAMVILVFAAAMLVGVFLSDHFDSIALGWIGGIAMLATLGSLIDKQFSGPGALERRIAHRQRVRHSVSNPVAAHSALTQQWRMWSGSTAREWTSTSAYRRHPQWTTTAPVGSSPDSTRRGSLAEYRIRRA
jgi:hypothetical protein